MSAPLFCRARFVAATLLLAAPLSACGGSASTATPSPTSTANRFVADTFTTTIPNGWTDRSGDTNAVASINATGTVKMLLYAPSTSAQIGNEHIDVSSPGQPVPPDMLQSYLESVTQNGATNATQPQPFNLNGDTGLFFTYDLQAQSASPAVQLEVQDMLVNHGGQTYEIVLNTAASDFAAQQPALQEILQSWRWAS